MTTILTPPFDISILPPTLAAIAPQVWIGLVLICIVLAAYLAGYVFKRLVRAFGRRTYQDPDLFLGSSWDLAAPLTQLLVFLAVFTGGAELVGFDFGHTLVNFWPKALAGLVIIGGAVLLATWLNRSLRSYGERANARHKVDDTLISFTSAIVRYLILGIAILMAMTQFGFAPGSLIAIVGAAGLAIALALQDTLKAVAAGFMLAAFRPFRIGDWVEIGEREGEVLDITPFNTAIRQVDNKVVLLTNDRVWGDAIVNHNRLSRRRLNLFFGVHYDTDLDHALGVLAGIADAHDRVLQKSDIWVGVHELGDWAITLRLRAWVPGREFIQVRADITKAVKQGFDAEGIEIPYPHQVELVKEGIGLKRVPESDDES
ncbi:MAG: mechanosensitive ion channel family protein [Hyphomonadaceae bacterium]|nr:mechanosensitive ion channel family protein [Hyphomonadaceae bacterium]